MIGTLLGDGSISNNNVYRIAHCEAQKDYLKWKVKQFNNRGIRNTGVKSYISSNGYNKGATVYYVKLYSTQFTKVLRRVFYKPKKTLGNRKLLNRLDALSIAIWYMDDGHINIRKTKGKVHGFYIKIATCLPKEQVQVIIDYFREVWDVQFYMFHEGKGDSFSLCCGTKEGLKFIDIVKPYVSQVPCMAYKIQFDLSQRTRKLGSENEMHDARNCEDIV